MELETQQHRYDVELSFKQLKRRSAERKEYNILYSTILQFKQICKFCLGVLYTIESLIKNEPMKEILEYDVHELMCITYYIKNQSQ